MELGQKLFQDSITGENYNLDLVYDSIDCFSRAISSSYEVDAEVEGISSCYLGKIFYKGLDNITKAKKHYRDCIRILETLKPRLFNENAWHKLMMKHMEEIAEKEKKADAEA